MKVKTTWIPDPKPVDPGGDQKLRFPEAGLDLDTAYPSWSSNFSQTSRNPTILEMVKLMLLMEKNPANQLILQISHYLQGFIHVRWCKISSIQSSITRSTCHAYGTNQKWTSDQNHNFPSWKRRDNDGLHNPLISLKRFSWGKRLALRWHVTHNAFISSDHCRIIILTIQALDSKPLLRFFFSSNSKLQKRYDRIGYTHEN